MSRYPDNEQPFTGLLPHPGVSRSEDALFLDGLDLDDWKRLLLGLEGIGTTLQWWMGDALVYGEERFGAQETYQWAERVSGRSRETLRNYAWVARRVPLQSRRAQLAWSFHQLVAADEPERQAELLDLALQQGWSKRQLTEYRAGPKILPRRLAVDYTCPRCGYGWSGPPRPVGSDVFEPPDEDDRPGAVNIQWPNPSLVSPRHMLLRIREEYPEARELAEEALAALDRYPQGYRCPRCGFEFSGDPGAKPEVPAQPSTD